MKMKIKASRSGRVSGSVPLYAGCLLIGLLTGLAIASLMGGTSHQASDSSGSAAATSWTCSMHPQINQPGFGQCPLCFMDLIPKDDSGGDEGPRTLVLSDVARTLAELETAEVRSGAAIKSIPLVGNITLDESRTRNVTAWVDGRIDQLFVNFTGMPVNKGDHMASIYSPSLISAHQELLAAAGRPGLLTASRQRLLRWGILPEQLTLMEKAQAPFDYLTIHAPISGIVVQRFVYEGEYLNQGTRLFQIADFNSLWLMMSAFESDSRWLRYGQKVEFTVEAWPGETFAATITFVEPVLDTRTRTVPVRANIDNSDGRLKPGMFARARIKVSIDAEGVAAFPDLSGKWVSPMHPEIIKDQPGECDVCGIDLVPAPVQTETARKKKPLLIPETAPLWTGKRSVVYRAVPGHPGAYEGVEIQLGPKVDGHYLVFSGLDEGDRVVVNGAFKIDAELQIRGRPSMMLPESSDVAKTEVEPCPACPSHAPSSAIPPSEPDLSLVGNPDYESFITDCMNLSLELAADNLNAAKTHARSALVTAANMNLPAPAASEWDKIWTAPDQNFLKAMETIAETDDFPRARASFQNITAGLDKMFATFGQPLKTPVFLMHCPMAFDNRGGNWYQVEERLANPYYGARMLRCGVIRATLPPAASQ